MCNEHVYIGLGSNLEQPEQQIKQAYEHIAQIEHTRLLTTSSLYSSKPMGPKDQPDYINSVCLIETSLAPLDLLHALQAIENKQGRERKSQRWGARTLDLDVLLFGQQTIDTDELTVPHYGMAEREFVLVPLFEIAPTMIMPDGKPLAQWVANCSLDGLYRHRNTSN